MWVLKITIYNPMKNNLQKVSDNNSLDTLITVVNLKINGFFGDLNF